MFQQPASAPHAGPTSGASPSRPGNTGHRFRTAPAGQEDILNTAQRQKLDSYENYLYLVLHRPELQADSLDLVQDQISPVADATMC
ncbi:MAG: hypothetical protein MZV65_38495 [Chromatiales bacterium]|nr:hypothetical protein [Chromatiales bacterium]